MPPFLRRNSEDPANENRGQVSDVWVLCPRSSASQTWACKIYLGLINTQIAGPHSQRFWPCESEGGAQELASLMNS